MGVYLSTPKTDKLSADGENRRLRFGLSSMQGWRTTMEDAVSCFRFPRGFRLGWNGIASAIAVPFHAGTIALGVIWGRDASVPVRICGCVVSEARSCYYV